MKRVLAIGSSGAGKSTLSRELQKLLGIEIIDLDQHYWRPNWIRPTDQEWEEKTKELVQKDEWIMDGSYQSTLDIRIPRADTIIFMDVPRLTCLWRILKRHFKKPKREVAPGCVEKINLEFIYYIWNFPKRKRPGILERLERWKNEKEIHTIHSEKEMWDFLARIKRRGHTS